MAFIFPDSRDPRIERVTEFQPGTKVSYRNMTMPAEIISGPHKSPGHDRYLIEKADGNVSLVPVTDIRRHLTRLDKVARHLVFIGARQRWEDADQRTRIEFTRLAIEAIRIADNTRGEA